MFRILDESLDWIGRRLEAGEDNSGGGEGANGIK